MTRLHPASCYPASPALRSLHRDLVAVDIAGFCDPNRDNLIQLRMAVHAGQVHRDTTGLAGEAVTHVFRLLEAEQLNTSLAACGAELGVVVSSYLHQTVIRHGPGLIDPAGYRPVDVAVKQTRARAWLHIPGQPAEAVRQHPARTVLGRPWYATTAAAVDRQRKG